MTLKKTILLLFFGCFLCPTQPHLKESLPWQQALSRYGTPKYGPKVLFTDQNPQAKKGGTLTLGVVGAFSTLNPFSLHGDAPAGLSVYSERYVFETLMVRSPDEPFAVYPLLAQEVQVDPQKKWIRFKLNPKATFSDGHPVTADDVCFSFYRFKEKGLASMRKSYGAVASCQAEGKHQVLFTFHPKEDGTYDPEKPLIMANISVLPKHVYESLSFDKPSFKTPVGSGPYEVSHIDMNRRIVYKRRSDYWGWDVTVNKGRYNPDLIVMHYYRDARVSFEAFKAGACDLYIERDPLHWQNNYDFKAVKEGKVRLKTWPHALQVGMKALVMNRRRPLFQDQRIRKAFLLAFPGGKINRRFYGNLMKRTTSFFDNTLLKSPPLPSKSEKNLLKKLGVKDVDPLWTQAPLIPHATTETHHRENLLKAQKLLEEAGCRYEKNRLLDPFGHAIELEVLLYDPKDQKMILTYAEALSKLGIVLKPRLMESSMYARKKGHHDFDLLIRHWGHTLSPGAEQKFYWHSDGVSRPYSANHAGVSDERVDILCTHMNQASSYEELQTYVHALDRLLLWGDYVIPLYHYPKIHLAYWDKLGYPSISDMMGLRLSTLWIQSP